MWENEISIREYRAEDLPALTRLWASVFGDSEALIAAFFRCLPGMGTGLAAEDTAGVFGAAYLIDGLSMGGRKVGYLYAVAVDPAHRGQGTGAALSRAVFALARERGCEILCTQPAEPGLFAWYGRILGVDCALRRRAEPVPSAAGAEVRELSPREYAALRETMLAGKAHLCLSPAAMEFQHSLCRLCGGGFYRLGDSIAAAYVDAGQTVLRELLAPADTRRLPLAAALGAQLGTETAVLCSPDPGGTPYLAALPGSLPADCVWNLSFD